MSVIRSTRSATSNRPFAHVALTRLSCRSFVANAGRLELHPLAYNLGNFIRSLAMAETMETRSLASLREKLIKIGSKPAPA